MKLRKLVTNDLVQVSPKLVLESGGMLVGRRFWGTLVRRFKCGKLK